MFLRWEKRKGTSELLPTRRFERPIERRWSQFNEIINSRRQLKLDRRRRDDTEQTRRISDTNKETDAIADDDNQQVNTKIERQRKNKANRKSRRPRLMTYDSLISVNDAVFSGDINWVLKPRPDGKRALLSITIMGIIVIDRDGRQLWSCSHEHVTRKNAALSYIPVGTCLDGIWSTGKPCGFVDIGSLESMIKQFQAIVRSQPSLYWTFLDGTTGLWKVVSFRCANSSYEVGELAANQRVAT